MAATHAAVNTRCMVRCCIALCAIALEHGVNLFSQQLLHTGCLVLLGCLNNGVTVR